VGSKIKVVQLLTEKNETEGAAACGGKPQHRKGLADV
jgi:hypothetical protein